MTGSKVAIVTGGSRGIGRAAPVRLAGDGAAVAIGYDTSEQAAQQLVGTIRDSGGRAVASRGCGRRRPGAGPVRADGVAVRWGGHRGGRGRDDAAGVARRRHGRGLQRSRRGEHPGHLQCGAGGGPPGSRRRTHRHGLQHHGGVERPGDGIYNATKGAVEGFTRVLAKEIGPRGVTVNAIASGPVGTELLMAGKSVVDVQHLPDLGPQHRIGQPVDIAAVALIVFPDAGWINGQIVRVNGGIA